jgi:hypothetical protein
MTSTMDPAKLGTLMTSSDMRFHPPRYRDYRWLETNAYTFTIPEALMGCHIWNGFRTNMDVVASHLFVFSSTNPHAGPKELDYEDSQHHIPMPPHNLNDFSLANGVSSKMVVPMKEWDVKYDPGNGTVFDLHLRGLVPPLHISETGTKDAAASTIKMGHLDQMMMVTGNVRLNGKDYPVNWPSWRDHSWSPRPEGNTGVGYAADVSSNFDFGAFGEDYAFFAVTTNYWDSITKGVVHNGYIIDHGEVLRLKQGEARFVYDDYWTTTHLEYELEDERGRTHLFIGTPKSFYHSGHSTVLAVVEWRTPDGEIGWGQYDWHGNLHQQKTHDPRG